MYNMLVFRNIYRRQRLGRNGFTLIETMVLLAIVGILLGIAALNLRPFADPLQDSAARVEGFLKQVRAKAMATTSAYRVHLVSGRVFAERAYHCSDTSWTADAKLSMDLPQSITISASNSSPLCFSSRGYATTTENIILQDDKGRTKQIQVLLGGAVRVR